MLEARLLLNIMPKQRAYLVTNVMAKSILIFRQNWIPSSARTIYSGRQSLILRVKNASYNCHYNLERTEDL